MQRMKMEVRQFGVMVSLLLAWLMVPLGAVHAETKGELLELEQIELKQTHIDGYLKIAPKLVKMFDRIDKAEGEPDKQLSADLEALAKEGGFQSFDELETVVSNITFVMSGISEDFAVAPSSMSSDAIRSSFPSELTNTVVSSSSLLITPCTISPSASNSVWARYSGSISALG